MKIAAINHMPVGAPVRLMEDIANGAWCDGDEAYTFVTNHADGLPTYPGREYIGTPRSHRRHVFLSRWTGLDGLWGAGDTRRMLRRFDELGIELIHLHNVLWGSIHLPMLLRYAERRGIPVVWTLHGCWPFTGKCPHFTVAGCEKWKTGCHRCSQLKAGPECKIDTTALMWRLKKRWLTRCSTLTIVGSSHWLADRARESFLSGKEIRMIHNGINLYRFQPMESDFRQRYHCGDRFIVLGVADDWTRRKGLAVMIELASRLDGHYQLVMVGTDDEVDQRLPTNVISIHRTDNKKELAQIYSAADVFVQPTQEETFGLVNVEALACGTPVITFDVGGCPEVVDKGCGRVVPAGDVDAMLAAIEEQARTRAMTAEACLRRAAHFSVERMCSEYQALFHELAQAK